MQRNQTVPYNFLLYNNIIAYHLGFENRPLDFSEHAYTLAINYPESLAANYCSNEQHNQLDDDDDDNED